MKTVAIIHGWAGGNWLFKDFTLELRQAGFSLIKDAKRADVIIAHSAGCYRLPKRDSAKLIMLVNLPYWPEIRLRHRLKSHRQTYWQQLKRNKSRFSFIVHLIKSFVSVLFHPALFVATLTSHHSLDVLNRPERIILVRNQEDAFCSPEIDKVVTAFTNVKFVELPGYHDDLHDNSRPYVDLILREYN